MDNGNIEDIKAMGPKNPTAKIELLGKYDVGGSTIIVDPIFESGVFSFRRAYDQIIRCCTNFFELHKNGNGKK